MITQVSHPLYSLLRVQKVSIFLILGDKGLLFVIYNTLRLKNTPLRSL